MYYSTLSTTVLMGSGVRTGEGTRAGPAEEVTTPAEGDADTVERSAPAISCSREKVSS